MTTFHLPLLTEKQHKDVIDLCPDNESVESHDDNSQDDDEEDNDDMFSGSSTGGGGPYDAVLQDFMIRSYLSKSRRNKPQTFSTSTGVCVCVCVHVVVSVVNILCFHV